MEVAIIYGWLTVICILGLSMAYIRDGAWGNKIEDVRPKHPDSQEITDV